MDSKLSRIVAAGATALKAEDPSTPTPLTKEDRGSGAMVAARAVVARRTVVGRRD